MRVTTAEQPRARDRDDDSRQRALHDLWARHRVCTRCADAGYIGEAHPVFSGAVDQRILLVGQAPGPVEVDASRPFAGRAGRQLMRWLERAGLGDEAAVRRRVCISSMTTCFPGRRPDGSGDRRPSPAEIALCAPWLDGVLELLAPRLVICVGGLATERFLGRRRRLDEVVGSVLTVDGEQRERPLPEDRRLLLPLPHPSGQSRWLNQGARRERLELALRRLGTLLAWADRSPATGGR